MKLTLMLLIAGILQLKAESYAQKVSLNVKNASLNEVVRILRKQTDLDFLYNNYIVKDLRPITVDVKNTELSIALDKCLQDQPVTWTLNDKTILITSMPDFRPVPVKAEITGQVTDEKGDPLPGVSVLIKGTQTSTSTNVQGEYKLELPTGTETLIFRFVGYKTLEIPVETRRQLKVSMQPEVSTLGEVSVVAYGTQKKISVVGAQSTVTVSDLQQPVRSLANNLAGRIAGVISVQRTGEPGNDDASVWIRGISTFDNSLSKPLVLVDGVPRSFANIDPEDIESFSVLKDASATAVYGVRGANGVIIIQTKKGTAGKPKVSFRYNEGITAFTKLPEFADGPTYMEMTNEALVGRGSTARYTQVQIDATRNGSDPDLFPNVNWIKAITKDAGSMRKANLNISGGSEATQYYVAASYYDENGLYKTNALQSYDSQVRAKRYNLTTNLSIKATKTTKIDLGVQGYLENANYPGTAQSTIFGNTFYVTPVLHPAIYSDGKIGDNTTSSITNPYALLTQTGYANRWRNQVFSNLRVTQALDFWVKGLSATGMFSFDATNNVNMARTKTPDTYIATGRDAAGKLLYQSKYIGTQFLSYAPVNEGVRTIYSEAGLNFNRNFGQHSVTGLLLYNQSDEVNTQTTSFINSLPYRFRGFAGRATYGFKNRYFAEGNFGYNGAENLSPARRYGFFPSGGLGWVISEENFFQPLKNVFQLVKVRATYGIVGNSNISGRRFAYTATVNNTGVTGYDFTSTISKTTPGLDIGEYASDVTWETSKKADLGIDLTTLGNRLNIQADLYRERREDIFLRRESLPAYIGVLNVPLGNVGVIENHGVDASMNYAARFGNWNLRLQGNLTYSKNKVIENDKAPAAYPWMEAKGRKVGQQFGYTALGLFTSDAEIASSPKQTGDVRPGDIRFKDLNGDNKIDAYDMGPIGYGDIPEIVYGFGFSLGYKAVSLSTLFQGVGNTDIWINGEGPVPFQQGTSRGNLFSNITDRWTPENPRQDAFYPRLSAGTLNENYTKSTWWIQSGRYLRLKTLQLDVSLPKTLVNKAGIANANVFLQGVNVLTFSPFKMWDVELGNGRGASYPNISTYSIGIDLGF